MANTGLDRSFCASPFEFGERLWPHVQTIYLFQGYALPEPRRKAPPW